VKQPTLSGHTRLKNSLVLRNALAAELGLNLAHVMPHLFQVEDAVGAQAALDEGRYRYALVSVCTGDRDRIVTLDSAVRDACAKARLAPRYAQYLALLLFAHWNTARLEDSEGFLARLNGSNPHPNPSPASGRGALISESLEAFTATDLQTAAFWMATAAGKTHVLHAGQAGQAHTDVLGTLRPVNAGRILALLLWLHCSGRGSNPHSLTFRLQTETTASTAC